MARYRYANGTRNRAAYKGAAALAKGPGKEAKAVRRGEIKPSRAKPVTPDIWARWEFPSGAMEATSSIFHHKGVGAAPKVASWLHQTVMVVKQRRKAELPNADKNAARVSPKKKAATGGRG